MCSFIRGLGVVGFMWVCLVHSGARSLGSFGRAVGVVLFILACSWGRRFDSGSLRSLRYVGFIRAWLAGGGVHFSSLGSFEGVLVVVEIRTWVFGFILARRVVIGFVWTLSRDRWFHSGLLGSFVRALGVVGFIWGRWVH